MNQAADRTFESFVVGETCALTRTISAGDVSTFAQLSGDNNPLHTDAEYAATTQFNKPVVHGMFLGALVSQLVGMHIPGKRCLLMQESLVFKLPAFAGDTVQVEGVIAHKSEAGRILSLDITIRRDTDILVQGTVYTKVL